LDPVIAIHKLHSSTRSPGTGAPAAGPIPIEGPIADGEGFHSVGRKPAEFDFITSLRNRPAVRGCFLDPRPLDLSANRAWLAHRNASAPREGLLSIRLGKERRSAARSDGTLRCHGTKRSRSDA
jgi:hypothetical protein